MGYLKQVAEYSVLSLALFAGVGAGSVKQESIDSKVRYVRKPGEPCVLPPEHRREEVPGIPDKVAYVGLAALVVGFVANEMRKKADERLSRLIRPDSPKHFFGKEEEF